MFCGYTITTSEYFNIYGLSPIDPVVTALP